MELTRSWCCDLMWYAAGQLSVLRDEIKRVGFDLWPAIVHHERVVDNTEWLTTSHTPAPAAKQITDALTREIAAPKSPAAGGDATDRSLITGFRPFYRDSKTQLPVTSSNVSSTGMSAANSERRYECISAHSSARALLRELLTVRVSGMTDRLSFWHTDVLVGGFKSK